MKLKKKELLKERFTHLHLHTEFSFLDAVITVKGFGKVLKKKGFTSCAITDHGNLNGVYRFVTELQKEGIKPIPGCEFYYVKDRHARGLTEEQKKNAKEGLTATDGRVAVKELAKTIGVRKRNHVVCLAKNNKGWRKIVRAMELAHKEGFYFFPRIDEELLLGMAPDVIVLTACPSGVPGKFISEGKYEEAVKWCKTMVAQFGDDFYVEIQPNEMESQKELNSELVRCAKESGANIVATNDCHYVEPDEWETHDVQLALRDSQRGRKVLVSDPDRFRYDTRRLYLMGRHDILASFDKFHPQLDQATVLRAVDATLEIDAKIEDDVMDFREGIMPVVEVEEKYDGDPDTKLWALVNDGWKFRKIPEKSEGKTGSIDWVDGEDPKRFPLAHVYKERVLYEMGEVVRLGFSKYFLVIHDIIWWCRRNGIRTGPGRGSVAGSLVAYLLGITSVDSIKWDCPFSRFISPDRIDYPDIDMDFPTVDRQRVKDYIKQKYGQDQVASICNYSTMKGKAVLKDVARVFGIPYGETEEVVQHIIQRASGDARGSACLEDTFLEFEECRKYYKRYPYVVEHAMKLEGNVRQLGVNAAGMVVSDEPLRNLCPVQFQRARGKDNKVGEYLVSWDKREVEEIGLLKLDVLGIEGLTYIQNTLDLIKKRYGLDIEPEDWEDLDDPKVYEQFCKGNTELVWQMNTQGAIRTVKKLQPDKFEHLMAITSLIRPGPLYSGITADYIKRRHGEEVRSTHPLLDRILGKTYGLCIYQEGATQIVHDFAGFTWAEADSVRKCISKKMGVEYMDQYKTKFMEGCDKNGIEEKVAGKVWEEIGQFGSYAFNKAHATAYSLLSYWTMWLKIYYPLEFMVSALRSESDQDKRRAYIKEARRLGLEVAPPDVNISNDTFQIDDKLGKTIRFGFVDIKGIGQKTVDKIVAGVPYTSFRDFVERGKVNKTVVRNLLKVGALDNFVANPKAMVEVVEDIIKANKSKVVARRDAAWEAILVPEVMPYTAKERENIAFELLALPPTVHPTVGIRAWFMQNVKHFKIDKIGNYEDLYDVEWSNIYRSFVGTCTRVQFQSIATKLDEDEKKKLKEELGAFADKMEGTERRIKINMQDDTDFVMAMSSPRQYRCMDENKVKENMMFLAIGKSVGDFRIITGLLVNLTDLMERWGNGEKWKPGDPEYFITTDPFKNYRKWIKANQEKLKLKPFQKNKGKSKSILYVIDSIDKKTKKLGWIRTATCVDWRGNIREVRIWPDDFDKYKQFFDPGSLLCVWIGSAIGKRDGATHWSASLRSQYGGKRIMYLKDIAG